MYKKVYRPLWSFDVQRTENWLAKMSEKGFHLVEIKRNRRLFIFKQGSEKSISYKIGYDKWNGSNLPHPLVEDGWNNIFSSKNWYVLTNEKPKEKIKTTLVREGTIIRNRKIFYAYCGILFFLFMTVFNHLINYLSIQNLPEPVRDHIRNVEGSPVSSNWFITYTGLALVIGLIILSIYSIYKIKETNKLLNEDHAFFEEQEESVVEGGVQLSIEKETKLKRQGKLIVKRKLGWRYAPDKLEKWLEDMEEKGYHLYRVSAWEAGFYFLVGSPRKISYCVEYQRLAKENSMRLNKEMGWEIAYSSSGFLEKWMIWSQEYKADEEKPELFTDKTSQLKQAKKIAISYSSMFVPLVILNFYLLWSLTTRVQDNDYYTIPWPTILLIVTGIVLFSSILIKMWQYYFRINKS